MKISALCTDIDGTLLDSRRELSSRTISVIRSLKDTVPVILASSRMPSAMRHLQQELDILDHPMICFNGGYVLHYDGASPVPVVIDSVQLPLPVCSAIIEMAKGTDIHVSVYSEDDWYAPALDQWTAREERITKVSPRVKELHDLLDHWQGLNKGAHKVMCMGPENEIHALGIRLTSIFGDQIHVYRSKSTYLEIAPRPISKATALKLVLQQRYDMELSEVMAFGDNYNDIDLLRSVGWGIAVENANPEVKAAAREITLRNTEDGVAIAIEKHFRH